MIPDLLTYGAIGLGLSLAILTYRLIQTEQNKPIPRSLIINTTYAYMILTIILSLTGFLSESLNQKEQIKNLKESVFNLDEENKNLKNTMENLKQSKIQFDKIKHGLDTLTSSKTQIIEDWKMLNQTDPAYVKVVRQIRTQLIALDQLIQKELNSINQNAQK